MGSAEFTVIIMVVHLSDAVPIPRKAKTIVSNETGVSSFLGGSLNAVNTRTKSESLPHASYMYYTATCSYMLDMRDICR